jgi:L-ascorbate metabolism protein UlaG (beta-lactamase superfamily)
MVIQFLRHATFAVTLGKTKLLVDPMFSAARAMDPVQNAGNQQRIPLVDLPLTEAELKKLLKEITGVLVTHVHRDHWDARAVELLPKNRPVLCQAGNEERIRDDGFSDVLPIQAEASWQGLAFHRTGGQHGAGEIGRKMGRVSGFVIVAPGEPVLYVAGDTIWCPDVAAALASYTPDVVVLNAGAAVFLTGGPITMTAEDVACVCHALPAAQVVAVHLEAVNHCGLTRAALRDYVAANGLTDQVIVPADGAVLQL